MTFPTPATMLARGGDVQYLRIIGWYWERYRRVDREWRVAHLFCRVEEHAAYPTHDIQLR